MCIPPDLIFARVQGESALMQMSMASIMMQTIVHWTQMTASWTLMVTAKGTLATAMMMAMV